MKFDEIIEEAYRTYKERLAVYGPTYKKHGPVIDALFPDGVKLSTVDEMERFSLLLMVIMKLARYSAVFAKGEAHVDSIHDAGVYCFLLEQVDREKE